MKIIVSGIDHSSADISRREAFALGLEEQKRLLAQADAHPDILGAVTLSTCNRTEVYLSLREGFEMDPFDLIEKAPKSDRRGVYTLSGREAFFHLTKLAGGLKSRIFAEDQILTQVKEARALARSLGGTDSALEVFFRSAVTSAKRIKTELRFRRGDVSAASAARDLLQREEICRVLVIGNGEMGRACAQTLAQSGFEVSMTLRQYRHGQIALPQGVTPLDYAQRFEAMPHFDAVLSATASPHFTVTAEALSALPGYPLLYLDLAVPRDIDPAVSALPGVRVLDIDAIADTVSGDEINRESLILAEEFIGQGWADLTRWQAGKEKAGAGNRYSHFPLFIDCSDRLALVVGGGKIAARRVSSLAKFDFDILVVAKEAAHELHRLAEAGRIRLYLRPFEDEDIDGVFLVVAATDDRDLNARIGQLAKGRGIHASVADARAECSFFFPAIADDGDIIAGVCSDGRNPHRAAKAAKSIREVLSHDAYSNRQP